jgi:hypothetical protein
MLKQNKLTLRRLVTLFYLAGKFDTGASKKYDGDGDYKQTIYFDRIKITDNVKKATLEDEDYNIHDITISLRDRGREFILYRSNEIPVKEWKRYGQDHIMTFSTGKKYREYLIPDKKIRLTEDAQYIDKLEDISNRIFSEIEELEVKIVDAMEKDKNVKIPKDFNFFKGAPGFFKKLFHKKAKDKDDLQ